MRKGERRTVRTKCKQCRQTVIIRSPARADLATGRVSPPFSPEEVRGMLTDYLCGECDAAAQG